MTRKKPNRIAAAAASRKGRPPGTPNRDYDAGQAMPSSCPKCRSTASKVLRKMTTLHQKGEQNGQAYNLVDLHRVQCTSCGQCRIDRTFRFEPPAEAAAPAAA